MIELVRAQLCKSSGLLSMAVAVRKDDGCKAWKPMKPTKEEVKPHHFTHQPYRSWCRWCVMGEAQDIRHKVEKTAREPPSSFN